MIDRRTPPAGDLRWMTGCAFPLIIAVACATFGTLFDIRLVAGSTLYCLGDLSSGEKFAGLFWDLSRTILFPVISAMSALVALPFQLLARLPWLAGRIWLELILLALTVAVSAAGPVAMVLYDVATEGTQGDCVLPWWPSWLPA